MKTEAAWIKEAERALPLDPKLTPTIIRRIQLDSLYEARYLYVSDGNPAVWAQKLDDLIHELETKTRQSENNP